METPATTGTCFADADCTAPAVCDLVTHECAEACEFCVEPGCVAPAGVCSADICQERRGLPASLDGASIDGVCRPSSCDPSAAGSPACAPAEWLPVTCEPLDVALGSCAQGGGRTLGSPCDDAFPELGCSPALVCHRTSADSAPSCRAECAVGIGTECGSPADCVAIVPGGARGVCHP